MIEDSKDRQFRGHVMGRCRVVRSPGISIYLQSHQLHFTQTERRDVIDDVEATEKASLETGALLGDLEEEGDGEGVA